MSTSRGLRERKKHQTRAELVRAGLQLIAQVGYDGVTTAAIAEAAGVSRATFFNYFASKEQLVLANDGAVHRSLMAEAITGRAPGEPVRAVLLTGVQKMIQFDGWPLSPDDELIAIRAQLLTEVAPLRAAFLGMLADLQEEWTELLVTEYHAEISRTEAAALVGAMSGAITNAVLSHLRHGGTTDSIAEVTLHAARTALG
ncbi:TetR/AcrR family transcriptional regulator [Halostreptopolyspora alba]|uniref:TetR/AcrR family transcriptional regulator n=1 Tax=Halostreptopolyspora alba TaxID=2487137 RepID=UPI00371B8ED8